MIGKIKHISAKTTKQWIAILCIYIVQLILAIFLAAFAYSKLEVALGNSLELDRLAQGFDRTIFSDFMNHYPDWVEAIQNRLVCLIFVFLVLSIFLHAGLLGNIRKQEFSISDFFNNAKKYLIRFAGVALVSILKIGFILFCIWKPFIALIGDPLQTFHSDKSFILTTLAVVIFTISLLIIVWLWSVLTRYKIVDGKNFVKAMKDAWKELSLSFIKYFAIGVSLVMAHGIIIYLYTWIVDDWGAASWFCVLGLVSIQQLFSLTRIWLRAFGYSWLHTEIK